MNSFQNLNLVNATYELKHPLHLFSDAKQTYRLLVGMSKHYTKREHTLLKCVLSFDLAWYANQVDHIPVCLRWLSTFLDCWVFRRADTGNSHVSDHMLLSATMRLKLKLQRSAKRSICIEVSTLKTNAKTSFQLDISNRYTSLEPDPDSLPDYNWQSLKNITVEMESKQLGITHRRQREWISGHTLQLT